MSHAPVHGSADPHRPHAHAPAPIVLDEARFTLPVGAGQRLWLGLVAAGVLSLIFMLILAMPMEKGLLHALASYHVGFMVALTTGLGALALVMIFHVTNAGWSAALRRQFENIASALPVTLALFLPILAIELFAGGKLFKWMNPAYTAGDPLYEWKAPYLNVTFFVIRAALYFIVWIYLARRLSGLSLEQDRTGDRWLTLKARFTSSWGLVAFALATAFAGFDWLMTMDYHWFSTMFGVYVFAGSILCGTAIAVIVLALLRLRGVLDGTVTPEHFHDLGKLLLSFSIFWAYIAFSQYFLIWYGNIPEETAWYMVRKTHGWEHVGLLLIIGHFAVPFLLLLWRASKRNTFIMIGAAAWLVLMHALDLFYVVRPAVYYDKMGLDAMGLLVDVFGIAGPVCIFLGFVVRRVVSVPVVCLKDPRLEEAIEHANYV